MSDQPPRLPRLDNFASFEAVPGAGRPRRKATWSLRPMHEQGEGATADAARFVSAVQVMQGLGRKPE